MSAATRGEGARKNSGSRGNFFRVLRAVLLAVAVLFILAGALRGEIKTVLQKGATVCLECVGIG